MKGNIRKKHKLSLFLTLLFAVIFGVPFAEPVMDDSDSQLPSSGDHLYPQVVKDPPSIFMP
jgi:hypothetical protein